MPLTLPLLHASQTVVQALPSATACLVVLAIAVAAGAAANAFTRLRRRTRVRAAIAAAWALTLIALLPSVVPYDHLAAAMHTDGAAAVHESHCHGTPSSCADAPVTSGPGQMLDAAPLLVAPVLTLLLLVVTATTLVGITRRPILRPPLLPVATSI